MADVHDAGTISKTDFNHWLDGRRRRSRSRARRRSPPPPKPGTKQYDAVKQQVMQFLVSAKWIDGEAKERGISATPRRGRPPVRADQGPVVPEREGLPALPEDLRPDRGGPQVQGPPRRALQQDPHAGHREQPGRLQQRDQEVLRGQRAAVLAARAARPRGDPDKKQDDALAAKQRVEGGESGRRSQRTSPTTPPRRSRAASCSASPRASRTRSSTRRCSPRSRRRSPARSRPTPATTSSASRRSPRPPSRASSSPSRASTSCWSRRSSRRSSTSSPRPSATTGGRAPIARRTT